MGGDSFSVITMQRYFDFNPLRPCGRRPLFRGIYEQDDCISIHSARVGGDLCHKVAQRIPKISIHSARVGGDTMPANLFASASYFNPLRPCGRRHSLLLSSSIIFRFQSTPPVWAETIRGTTPNGLFKHFNPLRPCGRRRFKIMKSERIDVFQSTPPVWAETVDVGVLCWMWIISIHSARVGGDMRAHS